MSSRNIQLYFQLAFDYILYVRMIRAITITKCIYQRRVKSSLMVAISKNPTLKTCYTLCIHHNLLATSALLLQYLEPLTPYHHFTFLRSSFPSICHIITQATRHLPHTHPITPTTTPKTSNPTTITTETRPSSGKSR